LFTPGVGVTNWAELMAEITVVVTLWSGIGIQMVIMVWISSQDLHSVGVRAGLNYSDTS